MYIVHIVSISFWKRYVYRSYRFRLNKKQAGFQDFFETQQRQRKYMYFQYFEQNTGIVSVNMLLVDSPLFYCWELGSRAGPYESTDAFVRFTVQNEVTKT